LFLLPAKTMLPGMSEDTASTVAASPLPTPRDPKLRGMANAIRTLAMDAVEQAKSGHPGMPMGMADIAAVLFTQFLR
jgi:transketolase